MTPPIRVLVINPSLSRTGAPIALLRTMQWCVEQRLIEPTFVLRDTGPLVGDFQALGHTILVSKRTEDRIERIITWDRWRRVALAAVRNAHVQRVSRLCTRSKLQAIYCNTATQGRFVSGLHRTGLPVVTHVHELDRSLRHLVGVGGIETVVAQSDALIAVSAAVRAMLLRYGASDARIVDVPEPIYAGEPISAAERTALRRSAFGVDEQTTVVAACGLPSWRKGIDSFLRVARGVVADTSNQRKVAFRWIGGTTSNRALTTLVDDIDQLGLAEQVGVIPDREDAAQVIACADMFLSTSREDPNPLVVLEAAAASCPVVCFRGSGGAEELVDSGGGLAVPYLDDQAMAAAVLSLIQDRGARARMGEAGRGFVLTHNTPAAVGEKVATLLARYNGSRRP